MFTNGNYESAESLQTKHRFLHWLHVMISKRPGTVESPGGIHRRRHQKRRKAVKLLPKCYPKQKSPAFRGVFSEKQSLYLRYFVILLKGLKSRKEFFHFFPTGTDYTVQQIWFHQGSTICNSRSDQRIVKRRDQCSSLANGSL